MPANPTKVGYTFKEWNTKADGTGTKFLSTTHVIDDITVYAVYTKDSNPQDPNNHSESGSIHNLDNTLPETGVDNSPAITITIVIAGLTILLLSLLQKAKNNL